MKGYNNLCVTLDEEGKKIFHAGLMYNGIMNKYPGIMETKEYQQEESLMFDRISACNRKEASDWCTFYMATAYMNANNLYRSYSKKEDYNKSLELRKKQAIKFLAAYSLMPD